jgi:cell fate regulator YaaT (PSP1 superfamily)
MSIFPLPVFEADADPHHRSAFSDEEIYARLEAPKTIVVRYGHLKHVGEFPYEGTAKPGCGSKLVARTLRGTEVVEMLTTTCSNSGCGKSVTRREMLDYIENSGGKDYPFSGKGRILRVATIEDLNQQAELETLRKECVKVAKAQIAELKLTMKLVEAEPILGGEQITFYYMSEDRVDFRELVQRLASQFQTRIEMRQVGARDEARLVADYERCGQHCCCKNFLKVLKPVSMRAAKVQKATLDPLKISGRCGRLMCCLRYEDQTYKELKANLPARNKRVGTSEGPGVVVDSKILVQLVLVRLEHDNKEIAVPIEELMDPETCPKPGELKRQREEAEAAQSDPFRGLSQDEVQSRTDDLRRRRGGRTRERRQTKDQQQDAFRHKAKRQDRATESKPPIAEPGPSAASPDAIGKDLPANSESGAQPKRKRRRRRRRRGGGGGAQGRGNDVNPPSPPPDA